jgi:hypothetical protein
MIARSEHHSIRTAEEPEGGLNVGLTDRNDRRESTSPAPSSEELLKRSRLYREFAAEREEILKHKWIESEKAGHDIGFARAVVDWTIHHRSKWLKARRQGNGE